MEFLKLPQSFFEKGNVVKISKNLLGKYLFTNINGIVSGGMIVETEAYNGRFDKACHAHNKRTRRTEVMFDEGGKAYVYLCYGIHYLFNITTNKKGLADAVLVRAIEPLEGVDMMLKRRNLMHVKPQITSGPGVLSQALGINKSFYGHSLGGDDIWVEDRGLKLSEDAIVSCPRIGVDYAGEDALLPWRFYVKGNKYVSKLKKDKQCH